MLPSGQLRERVTLESPHDARDALGGEVTTWREEDCTWAAIGSLTGRETNVAQQLTAVITHSVVLRPRDDVRPTWRLRWGDRILSIEAVLSSATKDRTTLLCTEGLSQADL